MSGLYSVMSFLFNLFFQIFLFAIWLRIGIRFYKISVLNPISQLVNRLLDPVLLPVCRLFRYHYTFMQRYDYPAMILLLLVEIIKLNLLSWIGYGFWMPLIWLPVYLVADLIVQPCDLLFLMIIIRVILSYTNPGVRHPLLEVLQAFTNPLLRLARRAVPDLGGFDVSPFLALVLLEVIKIFIRGSLPGAIV